MPQWDRKPAMSALTFEYEITPALAEDQAWRHDILPALGSVAENVTDIWQYCFTEIFNNAIDHSGGRKISVWLAKDATGTRIIVSDDGVGIFRKIQAALNLLDERHAILELSKGKLTTDPDNHSGQGIFFSSRLLDSFVILSGGACFSHQSPRENDWMTDVAKPEQGTVVDMRLENTATRTCKEVFDQYSSGDDYGFTKTVVPVSLAQYGQDKLVSRSQAKRVLARVELFKTVVFDFSGVETIGQAFADEIFRVFARSHPEIETFAAHANSEIRRVIASTLASPNVHY
ncbi:MAG TPA: DUF4325 domain-containing protein [Candidatus Solibacter sp.]|nr:DUF4325 domain-containing protein [Candidatus Solibacter sp.]